MPKGIYLHKPENYPPSRKGSKLSKEHLEALRVANLGNKHSLGKKDSEETRRLKSVNSARHWLGKKRPLASDKTKEKMSKSQKGHKVSEYTKQRLGNLSRGKFGRDHHCWVEDKKRPLQKAIREIYKYVEWRKTIFTRDNYTCVLCGTTGYVEADHCPIRFVDILKQNKIETIDEAIKCEQLWDTGNGRTLCKPCHLKTITWGRKPKLQKK